MGKMLSQVDLLNNYRSWRQGTGVFECFCRATPFVSLQHYPDMELLFSQPEPPDNSRCLDSFADKYLNGESLLVIDLPGEISLRCAFYLQNTLSLKPVLLLNNPLHPKGLVGSKDFISILLAGGENLKPLPQPRGFVLILDYDRYRDFPDAAYKEFFNNQYELSEEDLPEPDFLSFCRIKRLAVNSALPLKEDLANYLNYLQDQGLEILVENSREGI